MLLAICSIHHSQHKGRGAAGFFSQGGAPATPLPAAAARSRARGEQKVTKATLLPPAAHPGPRCVFTSSKAAATCSYEVMVGGTPPRTAWHEQESLGFTDNLRKAGRNNLGWEEQPGHLSSSLQIQITHGFNCCGIRVPPARLGHPCLFLHPSTRASPPCRISVWKVKTKRGTDSWGHSRVHMTMARKFIPLPF